MGKKANQGGNAIWAKSNEAERGGGGRITSRAGRQALKLLLPTDNKSKIATIGGFWASVTSSAK